jgi:hypothetical protein
MVKLDYGKLVEVLAGINANQELATESILPDEFLIDFSYQISLAESVFLGWATLTDEGKVALDDAWKTIKLLHDLPNDFEANDLFDLIVKIDEL